MTNRQHIQCWLFVAFGFNTAMRHSEILRARFEHIDFDRLRLHVPKAKTGMREQPITKELATILKDEMKVAEDPKGWIFPSPRPGASKTGHRHRMDKSFSRAAKAAKLDPKLVTPHIMRHTAITRLVQSGVDLLTIMKISGHKSVSMVQRYEHVHSGHIDKAVANLGMSIPRPARPDNPDTITQGLHNAAND